MGPVASIAGVLRRFRRRIFRSHDSTAAHLALGRTGEELAAWQLRRSGYRVLIRNFRGKKGGEIDLVCRDLAEDALVFVEVKTRRNEDHGRPIDAVDAKKRRRIIRGAMAWLRMLDMPDVRFRFDVVEVVMEPEQEIRIVRNAFGLPAGYYY